MLGTEVARSERSVDVRCCYYHCHGERHGMPCHLYVWPILLGVFYKVTQSPAAAMTNPQTPTEASFIFTFLQACDLFSWTQEVSYRGNKAPEITATQQCPLGSPDVLTWHHSPRTWNNPSCPVRANETFGDPQKAPEISVFRSDVPSPHPSPHPAGTGQKLPGATTAELPLGQGSLPALQSVFLLLQLPRF